MHSTFRVLWHENEGSSVLRSGRLPVAGDGGLLLRSHYSLVSRGTERLVALGAVPEVLHEVMRVPYMQGNFSFPLTYGYALVGEVLTEGHPRQGDLVFVMHPHQDYCVVREEDCFFIPADVPSRRAVLAANMETAVTALWDGQPSVGDRVLVVGFGMLGALVAVLLKQIPGLELWVSEPDIYRREKAKAMGFTLWQGEKSGCFDLAFHASASGEGLQTAMDVLAMGGRLVELSWYGTKRSCLSLGGNFHYRRLRLISSQVSHLPESHRLRWDYARRKQLVFRLLKSAVYDALLDETLAFEDLPAFFADLRKGTSRPAIGTVVKFHGQ